MKWVKQNKYSCKLCTSRNTLVILCRCKVRFFVLWYKLIKTVNEAIPLIKRGNKTAPLPTLMEKSAVCLRMPPPQHLMPTMSAFSHTHTLIQGCIPAAEKFHPVPSTCYLGDCVTRETHSARHWNTPPTDMGTPSEMESSVLGLMGINHLEYLMEVHLATQPTTSSSLCTKFVQT